MTGWARGARNVPVVDDHWAGTELSDVGLILDENW
jgi:hypothetical protein